MISTKRTALLRARRAVRAAKRDADTGKVNSSKAEAAGLLLDSFDVEDWPAPAGVSARRYHQAVLTQLRRLQKLS